MEEEDLPPFWLQSSSNDNTPRRHRRRLQRQASSIFLNSGVLLVVLLVVSFVFVSVVVPSLINFTSQVFRPSLIKKSWDSLNLVLVLFAVVCAFLGRNSSSSSNSGSSSPSSTSYYNDRNVTKYDDTKSSSFYPSTPNRWSDHDHHQAQDGAANYNSLSRLRNFNSYPDLRQESIERWRFYDDTNLNSYSFSRSDDQNQELSKKQEQENEQKENVSRIKDVDVDTSFVQKKVVYNPPSPPPPPQPPSPPPQSSKALRRKVKRTHEDLGHRRSRSEEVVLENTKNIYIAPPLSPPPRPLPPPPMYTQSEKKKGNDFLNSLRRKKKKQRQRSVENFDSLFLTTTTTTQSSKSTSLIPPPSPPPPPPPPPPPHFFQTIFKKGKTKKLIPPPPPPPPPFHVSRNTSQNLAPPIQWGPSRTEAQTAPITSHKPYKTARTSSLNSVEENVESGNSSPRIPIPPPPPPPPFKMPAWKFVLDGDYVRVESFNSSRSGSPDLDSVEDAMSEKEHSPMASKDPSAAVLTPMFCPSPDVNTKAENFIARFRAGLTFEKMDSLKGKSNLGPAGGTS